MPKPPTQINLADARPGMTLSGPILGEKGNLLLPDGIVLTEAILESLQRHQIDVITIADAEILAPREEALRQLRLARVEKLFRQPGTLAEADATTTAGTAVEADCALAAAVSSATAASATATLYRHIRKFRSGTTL